MPLSFLTMLLCLLFFFAVCVLTELLFRQKTYHIITGNGYFQTFFDKGKYGEYLTWKNLRSYENDGGKFLFNCYLPAENGKTSEIDVILIHSSGIFVMESKNYSGWIFGKETDSHWTQTLPTGKGKSRKERFFNPVKQNATHIKWLKNIIHTPIPIFSIIVFSKRCTLKNVTISSPDVTVIQRPQIRKTVKRMAAQTSHTLTSEEIKYIYKTLYPYTQVNAATKLQHIDDIMHTKQDSRQTASQKQATPNAQSGTDISNVPHVKAVDKDESRGKAAAQDMPHSKATSQEERTDFAKERQKHNDLQICPKCGAELVLRTAAKGAHMGEQFYGCSRFPKCRYRKSVSAK